MKIHLAILKLCIVSLTIATSAAPQGVVKETGKYGGRICIVNLIYQLTKIIAAKT